jgi:hypothetical protein
MKTFVFTWNNQGIRLSSSLKETNEDFFVTEPADFLPALLGKIQEDRPDLVAFGLQEDPEPGSHFHSHLLPGEMKKVGFALVERTKLMGVGKVTVKALWGGDLKFRGIRLSVYARQDWVDCISSFSDYYVDSLCRSKGAVVIYVSIPGFSTIAFICCHLPFDSFSLIESKRTNDQMVRQTSLQETNIFFNNVVHRFVVCQQIKHVFYFGDMNFRVSGTDAAEVAQALLVNPHDIYQTRDELLQQMRKETIYSFNEGIDNQGPSFLPTCKMVKKRIRGFFPWKLGKNQQRVPSWCDRILYREAKCLFYASFDQGETMRLSDHAAVVGLFEI